MMCFDILCHELTRGPKRENCDKRRGEIGETAPPKAAYFPTNLSLSLFLAVSRPPKSSAFEIEGTELMD